MENWLKRNVKNYEFQKTVGGDKILFIPIYKEFKEQEEKAKKYFRKNKIDYAASYTYLKIYLA